MKDFFGGYDPFSILGQSGYNSILRQNDILAKMNGRDHLFDTQSQRIMRMLEGMPKLNPLDSVSSMLDKHLTGLGYRGGLSDQNLRALSAFHSFAEQTEKWMESRNSLGSLGIKTSIGTDRDAISSYADGSKALRNLLRNSNPGIPEWITRGELEFDRHANQIDKLFSRMEKLGINAQTESLRAQFDKLARGFQPTELGPVQDAIRALDLNAFRGVLYETLSNVIEDEREDSQERGRRISGRALRIFLLILLELAKLLAAPIAVAVLDKYDVLEKVGLQNPDKNPPAASPKPDSQQLAGFSIMVVATETLNLREGPSTTQRVIGKLRRGNFIQLKKVKRDWALVTHVDLEKDGVSYTGWVKLKYIQPIAADAFDELLAVISSSAD